MKRTASLLSVFLIAAAFSRTGFAAQPHIAPVAATVEHRTVQLPEADRDFTRPALLGLHDVTTAAVPANVPPVVPAGITPQLSKRPTVVVAPTPAPHVTPAHVVAPVVVASKSALVMEAKIGWCESRDNYKDYNPASGASGRYQFLKTTWNSNVKKWFASKYLGRAMDYPPAVQDAVFVKVYESEGWRPWAASRGCWEHR